MEIKPEGYNTIILNNKPEISKKSTKIHNLASFELSKNDTASSNVNDAYVKLYGNGSSRHINICVKRRIDSHSSQYILELSCPLWIYNCTNIPIAIKQSTTYKNNTSTDYEVINYISM